MEWEEERERNMKISGFCSPRKKKRHISFSR